jgi:quercetin dioxygenase-like cupin family protein
MTKVTTRPPTMSGVNEVLNNSHLDVTKAGVRQTYCDRLSVINMRSAFFGLSEIEKERAQGGKGYCEFLRVPAMSAGLYVLAEGAIDLQRPHHEDEMYYVVRGRARFRAGAEDREVTAGSVIFVAGGVKHRFYDIAEEIAALVFFAPAES